MTTLSVDIPVFETERLILREPRMADLESMFAFFATKRSQFVGGPCDRFQVWTRLTGSIGHWILRGYGSWTVEDKSTGAIIGKVGIIHHDAWPEPELGWQLFAGFEGKGFAYEAAQAARQNAARHFGLPAPVSLIDAQNTRSLKLAERMGASFEREGEILGKICHVYRHQRVTA